MLTSNWKVSTGRSPQSFITFIQTTQNFVIILYIEDIETNLPIGKHTLRVKYNNLKKVFANLVLMVHLCNCFQFVAFLVTFNDLCCGLLSHAFVDNGPKLADWSK